MKKELLESILNIDMLADELMDSVHDIYHYKIPHDHQMVKSIIKFNYILICSFQDELDVINSFSKEDERIKNIMWSISPLLRAVKKYDGLRIGRNTYFAHYNRGKNNRFYPWWESLNNVKLPRTIKEIVFLHSIFGSIRAILKSQFLQELEALKKNLQPSVEKYFQYVNTHENIELQKENDVQELIKEVDRRLTEKQIEIRTLT